MSKGCVRNSDLTIRFTTRTENSRAIPVSLFIIIKKNNYEYNSG